MRIYKKWIAGILAAAMTLVMLAGCSSREQNTIEVDLNTVAEDLQRELPFKDVLNKVDADLLDNYYPSIDAGKLDEFIVYVSGTGSTAEEIALFKAKDESTAKSMTAAVSERVEDQSIAFQDYVPAEMVKIENAVVRQKGSYLFVVFNDEYNQAAELLDAILA